MLKRAWLSITRRKAKTLLLFCILFVVANLVITVIAVKNSTNEATEFAKSSIGSEVTLSIDMQSLRGNIKESKKIEIPKIDVQDAVAIGDSKYISGYSYSVTAYANAIDLEVVESEMEKMEDISIPFDKANGGMGRPNGNFGGQDFTFNMKDILDKLKSGDLKIEAVNNFSSIADVVNGKLQISYGDSFNSTDENAIVMSYDLAELNGLKVGDSITLVHTESGEAISVNIVGIYENSTSNDEANMFMNNANTIYTNIVTGEKFMTAEAYNNGNYGLDSCVYYLNDPNNYELFQKEADEKVDLTSKNLKLVIDQFTYQKVVGSIDSIGNFATIVLWVVIGASILLITLTINGQIRERNYEMGVLLSLGEKKGKIAVQIMTEIVAVATVTFLLATFTGMVISNCIGDNLSISEQTLRQEQQDMMFNRGNKNQYGYGKDIEAKIDVSVGIQESLILFGIGYIIVIFSMIIPTVNIFRYEPKEILSRRE